MEAPAKRVALHTLGCKLNFSETSTLARLFEDEGYVKVPWETQADIYVLNTCSVTEQADKKCRQWVRRVLQQSPHAYVAVVGCYAQLKPDEIAQIPGVDLVLGAQEKFNIVKHIAESEKGLKAQVHACEIEAVQDFNPAFSQNDRTRMFFKIQDGCDYSCAFCTIPLARGQSRSASIAQTIASLKKALEGNPAKEVVLTGVNTGDFGRHNGEDFFDLLQQLDTMQQVGRFRISSIEPNLLKDEIIQFVAESNRFAPHFHIPLQSGSNTILRKMRRRYLTQVYQSRVELIKKLMPHACIGVDVIVGFPGETDALFQETVNFLDNMPVSYLHVFTYSERDNTLAANMPDSVAMHVRAHRSKVLHLLGEKKRRSFYESQLGSIRSLLPEHEPQGSRMYGFTDNYVKVSLPYRAEWANKFMAVQLTQLDADGHVLAQLPSLVSP